jgi:phosphoribosylanthranilate isomerase
MGEMEKTDHPRPDLLVDAYAPVARGGTGKQADMEIARWVAARCRMLLAGGLTPANVGEAIRQVQPWGVDVSSGVEAKEAIAAANHWKDHDLIRAFIDEVRSAER